MKKLSLILVMYLACLSTWASIPTEEGLLKNLNNQSINGNTVTLKFVVAKQGDDKTSSEDLDYYKLVLTNEVAPQVFQIRYSNSQMLLNQIVDLKYISNLSQFVKNEKEIDKSLFYAVLSLITLNNSDPIESFLSKNGTYITKNKSLMNEEKMKLLRQYRAYLANNKGKGDLNSPLNPTDPALRTRNLELFKESTYRKSSNIKLVKENNEFLWKADWKPLVVYFTNEERRLRFLSFVNPDQEVKFELSEYVSFNGSNEIAKVINLKDSSGQAYKIQIYSQEIKSSTKEKSLLERFEEAKKQAPKIENKTSHSFLM